MHLDIMKTLSLWHWNNSQFREFVGAHNRLLLLEYVHDEGQSPWRIDWLQKPRGKDRDLPESEDSGFLKSIYPSWLVQSTSEKASRLFTSFGLPLNSFGSDVKCSLASGLWVISDQRFLFCLPSKWRASWEQPVFSGAEIQFENSDNNLQGTGALTTCCLIVLWQVTQPELLHCWEKIPAPLLWISLFQSHRVGGMSWGTEHPQIVCTQIVMLLHCFVKVAVRFKKSCSILLKSKLKADFDLEAEPTRLSATAVMSPATAENHSFSVWKVFNSAASKFSNCHLQ